MESFFRTDINCVSELSKQGHYDFIIVGSGLAGGILARKLVESNKRVLLIEKGGLLFSTHCLNTSRPHGRTPGPCHDNHVIYNAVKQKVHAADGSDPYVGGTVHCLGGRSNVWGLLSLRILKEEHEAFFPQEISDYLENGGYENAFRLLTNNSQCDGHVYPNDDIDPSAKSEAESDLNSAIREFYRGMGKISSPVVDLSPMAAEFKSLKLYNFPQGAYSTVDFLLERLYARDPNLTVLLNTEVLALRDETKTGLSELSVRSSAKSKLYQLCSKTIILSAGTIGTATIALNSGLQKTLPLAGKGLSEHEIWILQFRKELNAGEQLKDPMKSFARLMIGGEDALVNFAINANSFLARQFSTTQAATITGNFLNPAHVDSPSCDTVSITVNTQAKLSEVNEVLNIPSPDSVVYVKRTIQDLAKRKARQADIQNLATTIRNKLLRTNSSVPVPPPFVADFGAVSHEVGTMRMQGPNTPDFVVDKTLQIKGRSNLYVCDLSIFPFCPMENPSLTLAAIALWLAERLSSESVQVLLPSSKNPVQNIRSRI